MIKRDMTPREAFFILLGLGIFVILVVFIWFFSPKRKDGMAPISHYAEPKPEDGFKFHSQGREVLRVTGHSINELYSLSDNASAEFQKCWDSCITSAIELSNNEKNTASKDD